MKRKEKDRSIVFLLPLLLTSIFFIVAASPAELLGCRNRGLIAVSIALPGGMLAIAAAAKGVIERAKGCKGSFRFILAALLYALPACYIVLISR